LRKAKVFGKKAQKKVPYIYIYIYVFRSYVLYTMNKFVAERLSDLWFRTLKYCSSIEGSSDVVTCWYSDHANLIFRRPTSLPCSHISLVMNFWYNWFNFVYDCTPSHRCSLLRLSGVIEFQLVMAINVYPYVPRRTL
jgi:hypothetical protein